MGRSWQRRGAILIVVGLVLGGTGAEAMAHPSPELLASAQRARAAITTKRVRIVDFNFAPRTITITHGTRVRWLNTGSVGHTSTSNTGAWDSGVIAEGSSFSRVFRTRGTFRYHCSIHATMMGTIRVT